MTSRKSACGWKRWVPFLFFLLLTIPLLYAVTRFQASVQLDLSSDGVLYVLSGRICLFWMME